MKPQYCFMKALASLIDHLLSQSRPCTLLACCSKEDFLSQLASITKSASLSPSLQRLALSKNVKILFVPSLSHLRAVLSDCSKCQSIHTSRSSPPLLVIANCLQIH